LPANALMIADCRSRFGSLAMVICPVALAVGCVKCPIFKVCPVKSVIGDYKKPVEAVAKPPASASARPVRKAQARKKKRR
jgi:hypothetical protein